MFNSYKKFENVSSNYCDYNPVAFYAIIKKSQKFLNLQYIKTESKFLPFDTSNKILSTYLFVMPILCIRNLVQSFNKQSNLVT